MQQSNAIFAFVFIAFLFFITARGELRKYMGFLFSSPGATTPQNAIFGAAFNAAAVSNFTGSTFQTAK